MKKISLFVAALALCSFSLAIAGETTTEKTSDTTAADGTKTTKKSKKKKAADGSETKTEKTETTK